MMVRRDPAGLGMTSQRARDRMVEQLRALGIQNPRVLDAMRSLPRHLADDRLREEGHLLANPLLHNDNNPVIG